ncbi:MAG TPA: alpha/beta hydrolase [Paucimonas sp.]|nr:alpha/beta hydrolase [Paucimonas sp.]HJW54500.1 alpha/beta hydrolase [Burkholderiaceae bacterium]
MSFRPHDGYLGDVRAITKPTRILIGANDELFIADQYARLLEPIQPKLRVKVLPEISHIGIVVQPVALAAIVAES